jgi:hypothetical protein
LLHQLCQQWLLLGTALAHARLCALIFEPHQLFGHQISSLLPFLYLPLHNSQLFLLLLHCSLPFNRCLCNSILLYLPTCQQMPPLERICLLKLPLVYLSSQ